MWTKLGLVFKPTSDISWATSHATCPTPIQISDGIWRVFFSSRDENNRSHVGFFDLNLDRPSLAVRACEEPVLAPGPIGNFDGNGIYATSVVRLTGRKLRFYTIGWNPGHRPPLFYASIGAAESEDFGRTISWRSKAPIMERSEFDPASVTGPWVLRENGRFRMWYVSGYRWDESGETLKSVYHIKYAESDDGLKWMRKGVVSIDHATQEELNIARPCVLKGENGYEAWFSYTLNGQYRIGYGVSKDGIVFNRNIDNPPVIECSESYFENKAVCHPVVIVHKGKRFLFYNGNQFGFDGVALAEEDN